MNNIDEQIKQLRDLADGKITFCEWKKGEILKEAADTIESLHKKQSDNVWIPCSERLPEEDTDVLIYTPYDGVDIAYISDDNWRYTRGGEFIGTVENLNVIAWQPLPEPYKAD